jgi:hypothetical protein
VLSENTEIRGIVVEINRINHDLWIVPDPDYRHLLLDPGNTRGPGSNEPIYPRWKELQDKMRNCGLSTAIYPEPYPIIRLESYGYGPYSAHGTAPPTVIDAQRPSGGSVLPCDHIRATGVYVTDHGHTLWGSCNAQSTLSYWRGIHLACYAHAELHPYHFNSVRLVPFTSSLFRPNDANVESHTIVVPYYNEYYRDNGINRNEQIGANGVVDSSKRLNANAEWFIEAPPQPTGGCPGGCELKLLENRDEVKGTPTVNVVKESNGFRIYANVDVPNEAADYYLGGSDTGGHWKLAGQEVYSATFWVYWEPINKISLRYEPSTIIAKLPTSIVVYAVDANNQTPVNGSVIIGGAVVGNTNVPFNYTFNSSYGDGKVTAPNYAEASLRFNINNKLDVIATPNTVDLGSSVPTDITITAHSPATNQPIEGKVLTNEGGGGTTNEIGSTNTPFLHDFEPHIEGRLGQFSYHAPEVIVVAPTYDKTPVRIEFTNIPQPETDPGTDPGPGPEPEDPCERLSPEERRRACEINEIRQTIRDGNFTEAFSLLTLAEQKTSALQENMTFFGPSNTTGNPQISQTIEDAKDRLHKAREALNDDNTLQALYNIDLAEDLLSLTNVRGNITTFRK